MIMRAFLLTALFFILATPSHCALRVVTTTEDLAALTREVGGTRVKVQAIAKGYQDPHFVDAKPSYLLKLKRADLYIQVGLELEVSWAPSLLRSARNKKIRPGNPGFLDASVGCEVLDRGAAADRSQGDVHPEGNPHYWLDPENGKIIARNIKERLARLDPQNAAEYGRNLSAFERRLAKKRTEWEKVARAFKDVKAVTYHDSWPNFVKRFGIDVIGFIEPKPGIPASPAHLKDLIALMRKDNVRLIFMEPYFDEKLPRKIAAETGAKLLILPPSVGAVKEVRTYFDLFDYNLGLLASVAGGNP